MELRPAARRELIALVSDIVSADAASADLATAERVVRGCQRLRAVLAARDAEFTPVLDRLRHEAALAAQAGRSGESEGAVCGEAAEGTAHDDAAPAPAGPAAQLPLDAADVGDEPAPIEVPRESAADRLRRERRATWLAHFSGVADALTAGVVSPEHIDRLAMMCQGSPPWVVAALSSDEGRVVRLARANTPDGFALALADWVRALRTDRGVSEFEQQLAESRASIWLDRATGLYHLHAVFDPERGPVIQDALDQQIQRLHHAEFGRTHTRRQTGAQALFELITGAATVNPRGLVVADVLTALTGVRHDDTICESVDGVPLPPDRAVLACASGHVRAAILDRSGKPADLTTDRHLADAAQRDDLRSMHTECVHPDCTTPFSRCHVHHVRYWHRDGGSTAVSNLVPICVHHHHDVHDRGWSLTIDGERTVRWYEPGGALYAEVPLARRDHPPGRAGPPGDRAPQSSPIHRDAA